MNSIAAADPEGGGGGHGPLSLLKLVIKKDGGALYFTFLGPPLTILDPMLNWHY